MGAFATQQEVATRLGRALSSTEQAQVTQALGSIADLIRDAAGKAADWEPDAAIPLFKTLSIEKAIGVVTNPSNLASESEQLGVHQHSKTFPRAGDVGVFLTNAESRQVRRAVYGSNVATPKMGSVLDDLYPCEGS